MSVALDVAGASPKRERRNRDDREPPAADRPDSMTRSQHRLLQQRTTLGSRDLALGQPESHRVGTRDATLLVASLWSIIEPTAGRRPGAEPDRL